ncbi:hypothetical protein GLAREA_04454 [Glarea lozoyensis ATCC 20868]|uniref:Uncharacterized protein n=1 Tax=Glarea lozoyensis (strain ATCC 20868 / MF5171) TaxID=1116229 RepID=S3DMB9_GLAL2|nr:uncharacterized protein GLAREA_04454 [Glarea lozoyensis ATCC 20868]EPE27663.1 hypothetical protein GLAREA_04454 [Glarea lozoyensis ATCC 20868]
MPFSRRPSASIATISMLIAISVLVVISIGEGFKFMDGGKDVSTMNKRWVRLGWRSDDGVEAREAKSPSPIGAVMGVVKDIAGPVAASPKVNDVEAAMAEVQSMVGPVPTADVDQLVQAGSAAVGSLLAATTGVSNIGVLADSLATSMAASSQGGKASGGESSGVVETKGAETTALPANPVYQGENMPISKPNVSAMASGGGNGTMTNSTRPQNTTSMVYPSKNMTILSSNMTMPATKPANISTALPSNTSTTLAPSSHNQTTATIPPMSLPSLNVSSPALNSSSALPQTRMPPTPQNTTNPSNSTIPRPQTLNATCPAPAKCPIPVTETCTETETWHSTVYSDTVTLFSFMDVLTVTCTVTVSGCDAKSSAVSSMGLSNLTGYGQLENGNANALPKYSVASSSSAQLKPGSTPGSSLPSITGKTASSTTSLSAPPELFGDIIVCGDGRMVSAKADCGDGGGEDVRLEIPRGKIGVVGAAVGVGGERKGQGGKEGGGKAKGLDGKGFFEVVKRREG